MVELREHQQQVFFRSWLHQQQQTDGAATDDDTRSILAALNSYFNLGSGDLAPPSSLEELHAEFARRDQRFFAHLRPYFPGLRVISMDCLLECLISFICSANNNVGRITLMVRRIAERFGTPLGELELRTTADEVDAAATTETLKFYSFPTLEQLSSATEKDFKDMGCGYRARYLVQTIKQLRERDGGGTAFLASLRDDRTKFATT